ncbi:MAG: putative quinol monooxygenase [Syntrophobacteraceae bacterium]
MNYDLHQATDEKSQLMFFENWESMEDLAKHRETPRLKAFRQKAGSLLARPIGVTLLEMISDACG